MILWWATETGDQPVPNCPGKFSTEAGQHHPALGKHSNAHLKLKPRAVSMCSAIYLGNSDRMRWALLYICISRRRDSTWKLDVKSQLEIILHLQNQHFILVNARQLHLLYFGRFSFQEIKPEQSEKVTLVEYCCDWTDPGHCSPRLCSPWQQTGFCCLKLPAVHMM